MKHFIYFTILAFLLSCGEVSSNHNNQKQVEKNIPDQESWNTEIIISASGQKKANIYTNHLRKYNKLDKILMDDSVHATFYDSLGRESSQLFSNRARVNRKNNNIYAAGDVVVKSDSGVTLYADSLRFLNEVDLILSDAPVTFITKQEDTLNGTSFQSNVKLQNWKLSEPTGVTPRNLQKKLKKDGQK